MNHSTHQRRSAFTLVELLVVIGIIALLISILLPVLSKAKEQANAVKCGANLRTLMSAFLMFAQDHKDHLPGLDSDRDNKDWWKRDFLVGPPQGVALTNGIKDAPRKGTIWKYVRSRST